MIHATYIHLLVQCAFTATEINLFWHTECPYVITVNLCGRVLSCCREGDGPQHIKVVLEWEYSLYKRYVIIVKNFTI